MGNHILCLENMFIYAAKGERDQEEQVEERLKTS